MTLKDKFIVVTGNYNNEELVLKSIKIADEFAIGFAEWLNGLDINDEVLQKHISTKGLVEIYKKEKGL
jgi:hypothetical protein